MEINPKQSQKELKIYNGQPGTLFFVDVQTKSSVARPAVGKIKLL